MKVVVAILLLVATVYGHAKLDDPRAWNTQPSKTTPCGGGSASTVPTVTWQAGTTQIITWTVVAGDGAGTVTANFDPAGGTNFGTQNSVSLGNAPAVGTYSFSFTVPSVQCTGTAGCTMQVISSSGWVACSTVQINVGPPDPNAPKPKTSCVKTQELIFCREINGQYVSLPAGVTALQQDKQASDTYTSTRTNPNVFSNGNATECATAYKNYLCRQALPHCGDDGACKQLCNDAVTICQITTSHAGLYDCTKGPDDCDAAGLVQVGIVLLVALLALLL